MNTWTKRFAALLLILGSAFLLEPRASAQLGSLVVTISSPTSGSTVSGTTTVTANVSIIGALTVSGVQFKLDGANLGAEDTSAPYSIPWNTTTTSNGSHTLTAVGRVTLLSWASDPVTVTVLNDTTAPTVTINQAAGQSDPTSASPITFTAVFSEAVSGFTAADVTISGTAGGTKTVTISGGPSTYTVAVSGTTTSGTVIATIPAGGATDAAGNANTASTSTDNSVTFNAPDTTAPTVTINQAAGQADPTSASPITFTAVFSEAVSGFAAADVTISGTAGGTKTVTISGGPSTYTVAVSGMTTSGTVIATIPAGGATDAAGNANTASTSTDNSVTFNAPDTTAPTVTINQAAGQADPTSAAPITFTAVFSEPVSGFAAADVTISGTAGGTKTVTISGGPSTYTVAVSGMTTSGTVIATIPAGGATDAAGNANTPSTSTDNSVTFNAPDTTAPTVTINQAAGQADPTSASPITFTAVFSEPVSGFAAADVTISGTAGGTKTVTISGGPSTYTVAVSGTTTSGTVIATIPAGGATDAAGNANTASTSTDNSVTFNAPDTTAPTVTINQAAGQADPTSAAPITFTAVFSESVSGFTSADVAIGGTAGGSKTVTISGGPSTYTIAVGGMTDGTVTATIAAGGATDAAGNANTASTSTDNTVSFTAADTTAPAVTINQAAGQADPTSDSMIMFTAVFSEAVSGFTAADVTVSGTAGGTKTVTLAGGPSSYTVGVSGMTTDGTVVATIAGGGATDAAGNANTASTSTDNTVSFANQAETTTRLEDTNAAIFYTPAASWMTGYTDSRPWSGGSAALGFGAGYASLSFTGTGVSWIGFRGPQTGIARVHLDGTLVATVDAYSPTELTQAVLYTVSGLPNASHSIAVEVTRTKNDASSDFYVIVDAFDVTGPAGPADTTPPSVTFTSPTEGATLSGTVTLTATASDDVGVARVQFYVDGNPFGDADTTAPYSTSWNTMTATEGSHNLMAQARDAAGNTSLSAIVHVTVSHTDTTPPAVAVTSPSSGATVFGTVTVNANASDNMAVAGVQFFVDGAPLGAEDTSAPYSATWDTTTAVNGSHALTARARDGAGNTATSAAVTVTVTNGAGSTIRIEDGNTAISYGGAWNVGNTSRPWSGGTAAVGFGVGQLADVTFSGTGITWIGFRAPWAGIANVYVDGAFAATIDAYAPAETVQAPMFTAGGLPLGTHTLTIEVTHTKNASSSDFVVIVDAFDISGAPPDATAPTVSITSPGAGATVFGSVPVRASADDNNGVASVTFFIDGVQLGVADTISPYLINWNTATVTDGPHTLTAVARDATGNTTTSSPVAVTVANAAPPALATATRIENTNLGIVYVDGCSSCGQPASWFHGSRSRTWSDGTSSFNRADGGRATFTFTGTAVKWIGFRAAWAGIARVFVDGAFVAELDLYSPTEEVQVPVFQVADLAPGTHTIAVEATGRKNPDSGDYAVVVDAFDVSPAMPPPVKGTRYEENASSATFTPGWNMTDTTHAWSGATAAVSSGVGERATFVFTGTSVNWIGKRGPEMGIARVYLDGAIQAQVDSYHPSTIQGLVYSVTGLARGQHRLEIEVTGFKHDQATGHAVAVDAFDVRSRIEENDGPVAYSGTWRFDDTVRNWSDTSLTTGVGTAAVADTAGARADLTFAGTAVTWIGARGPWLGIADVYLDGVFAQQIDLYSATEQIQAPIFTASGLAPGTHTVRVEATGTKNPASATARVVIDTFDVTIPTPAPPVTRVQDTDAAVAYSAGWVASGTSSLWSGTNAKETRTVGAQATFSFSGTSIRWIGERGFTTGLARVSIDGQFIALVDTRTPFQEEYQEPMFTATGLAPGTHTLTIEVVGRNNEAPGTIVERIVIDAFDIQP